VIVVGFLGAPGPDGESAVEIARLAAATGARVEIVGIAPADAPGDALLVDLAAQGIGHATVIRSSADRLEPADLDLALRYLPDIRAIVLVRPAPELLPIASSAAAWAPAGLVVVGAQKGSGDGAHPRAATPPDSASPAPIDGGGASAIVLEPPDSDPDATFAGFVAAFAVRLDAGEPPEMAWRSTVGALAVDRL
jgi:hypothetical protein